MSEEEEAYVDPAAAEPRWKTSQVQQVVHVQLVPSERHGVWAGTIDRHRQRPPAELSAHLEGSEVRPAATRQ